jgi:hypothetical protein
MKARLDMKKIARGLGAVRQGRLRTSGGYFGAMQLLGDIEERFRVPSHGGRATDPRWTERRLVPLAPKTLERLERIAAEVRRSGGGNIETMQLAALLLEKTAEELSEGTPKNVVTQKSSTR